jgi:integrase
MATLANSMSAHAIKIAKCSTESLDTGTRPDHRGDTMGKEPWGKLLRMPVIRLLKEAAPRAGFFEPHQYEAVHRRLRPDLRVAVAIGYAFGWRVRDEVLTLERRHVDLTAGTLRIDPGTTKNADGRLVYLTPALATAITEQLERVRTLERKLGRVIPYLFP